MRENGRPVMLYVYRGQDRSVPEFWIGEKCGSYAGWNVHQRNHEPACPRCRRARAEYVQQWRLRTGRVKTIRLRPSAGVLAMLAPSANDREPVDV